MTHEELRYLDNCIQREFDKLALSITTAILMSGYLPDIASPVVEDGRTAKAILVARQIVNDAAQANING